MIVISTNPHVARCNRGLHDLENAGEKDEGELRAVLE